MLILRDQRLDFWNLPDLMSLRIRVMARMAREFRAAATTLRQIQGDDVLTVNGGKQRPLVPGYPDRSPGFPRAFCRKKLVTRFPTGFERRPKARWCTNVAWDSVHDVL